MKLMKTSFIIKFNLRKNFSSKVFKSSEEAIRDIKSGNSIMTGGFGLCGIPENLLRALAAKRFCKRSSYNIK